jgi:hypothetical protein
LPLKPLPTFIKHVGKWNYFLNGSSKNKAKHAADFEDISTQSIRKTRNYGATQQ